MTDFDLISPTSNSRQSVAQVPVNASAPAAISKARVRRVNGAYALVTDRHVAKDEIVFVLQGEITEKQSKYSIQIGEHKHLEPLSSDPNKPESLIHFFNHSCDPNTYINFGDLTARALRALEPGEEVTFNYNTTEHEMVNHFKCHCNSESCLVDIRGFRYVPPSQRARLIPYLAPHLRGSIALAIENRHEQE